MRYLRGFLNWVRLLLSEPDGSPSSTRVLMYIFAGFSLWLDWRIFYHLFHLNDASQLSIWLSNLPMIIGGQIGLIALPYTVNKSTNTLSDMATMFASIKNGTSSLAANSQVQGLAANAAQAKVDTVGTAGPKG